MRQTMIDDAIFQRHPAYVRGVVVAHQVSNSATPPELQESLRQAMAQARRAWDGGDIAQQPQIHAWREAFRAFGAKPSEFRPAHEALIRRILNGQDIPAINTLVDIGNLMAVRHWVPAGAHALDDVTHDLALRVATGTETFVAFGAHDEDHPLPGEIIFAEDDTTLTRRWVWRQARHTATQLPTRAVLFNVDGLPPVTAADVTRICHDIADLIHQFCGGATQIALLTRDHPATNLTDTGGPTHGEV